MEKVRNPSLFPLLSHTSALHCTREYLEQSSVNSTCSCVCPSTSHSTVGLRSWSFWTSVDPAWAGSSCVCRWAGNKGRDREMGNLPALLPANVTISTAAPCVQTLQQLFLSCQLAGIRGAVLLDILLSLLVPSPTINYISYPMKQTV